jgi:hypothetical protein
MVGTGKTRLAVVWFCLTFAVLPGRSPAGWQVWTTADTRRALRGDQAGAGLEASIAAARNEWVSFQVLMRSDSAVKGVTLEAGDLSGPEGAVLKAQEARLFRQHQIELTVGTARNDGFKPDWYPDPLIPFRHPVTGQELKGAALQAVPFDLPADQTHGFWVDLYVPSGAKAGTYRGTYRVTAEGAKPVEVPVTLTVWDFELPAVPAMQTAFGSPAGRMRDYYTQRAKAGKEKEPADWPAVEAHCAQTLSEHRINATPPSDYLWPAAQADGSYRIGAEKLAALAKFIERYHVNALQVSHPKSAVKDPQAEKDKLQAWLKSFDAAAAELKKPDLVFFIYLIDEPNDAKAYEYVRTWGKAIRDAKSVVKVMITEQDWPQNENWGDLYGAVDIWCPLFPLFKPETAAKRQALGETFWAYTALCQQKKTPWWHIDWPLLNYRVPAWICWRYRIRGLLYWGGMSFWKEVDDPWTDARTYGRKGQEKGPVYNGEGTLVYPGRAVGYDGIGPSLRLKALRDGVQDYEYLAILERLGKADEAQKIVEPPAESWFKWDGDPAAWQKARAKLAELIVAAQRQSSRPAR